MKNIHCPNTLSGNHYFIDTSYKVGFTELLYDKKSKRPQMAYGSRDHFRTVKGDLKCKYCAVIDDLNSLKDKK